VRTHHQTIWLRAGFGSFEALTTHLSTHGLEAWPEDFNASPWRSIAVAWDAVRIHPPSEAEWVAHHARLETTNIGIQVVADCPAATNHAGPAPGKRVRVEAIAGQTAWLFSAVVLPHAISTSPASDNGEQVILSLLPLDEEPTRRPRSDGAFRMNMDDPVEVKMSQHGDPQPQSARLAHLSVEGMGLNLDGPGPAPGSILRFSIPKVRGGHVHIDGEVFHYSQHYGRNDGVGVRFMSVTEQVRTVIQREVLQHERIYARARSAIDECEPLSDDLTPYMPIVEEDSVDLTK
jgi:hypothetical protein